LFLLVLQYLCDCFGNILSAGQPILSESLILELLTSIKNKDGKSFEAATASLVIFQTEASPNGNIVRVAVIGRGAVYVIDPSTVGNTQKKEQTLKFLCS
jgi:hypothetical protein